MKVTLPQKSSIVLLVDQPAYRLTNKGRSRRQASAFVWPLEKCISKVVAL